MCRCFYFVLNRTPAWAVLTRVLADTHDDKTQSQEGENPAKADHDSEVNFGPLNAPASAEDVPQRLDGVRLRQEVGNVTQVDGHALHRPKHTAEQEIRVEAAQWEMDGTGLFVAQSRHHQTWDLKTKIRWIISLKMRPFFFYVP